MEQQWSPGKTRQETRQEQASQTRRKPERARLAEAEQTARAVLEGAPVWEIPPARLEELAGWLGNQGMNEMVEAQSPPLEEVRFAPPAGEPGTVPFPVPETAVSVVAPPPGLTVSAVSRAFDPAGLAMAGGGYDAAGI